MRNMESQKIRIQNVLKCGKILGNSHSTSDTIFVDQPAPNFRGKTMYLIPQSQHVQYMGPTEFES